MINRREHQQELVSFLQKKLSIFDWRFSLPPGTGMETYFARGNGQRYFVKVGIHIERYLAMAETGLTPPVLSFGQLADGLSIIVQPFITGRKPSRIDYRDQLEKVAALIHKMHHHPRVMGVLRPAPSNSHKEAGLRALNDLRRRWEGYRIRVPNVADFVDKSLDELALQINQFSTDDLVASHNDICNANWLFASTGEIYMVDFESMTMDDPAFDLGAILWWYYPAELRQRFLNIAGYPYDEGFKARMRVRMALHCLSITIPREGSFDRFNSNNYARALEDFKAVYGGRPNPQGYSLG